jgi:hypothetical protein
MVVTVFVYGQEEDAVFQEDGVYIHPIKKKIHNVRLVFARKYLQNYLNKYIVSDRN